METLHGKIHKPPAVVIIARHGARIDAVDKEWHFTSPTPYDPPLSYGGWMQGRALGVRIATLLKAREIEIDPSTTTSASSSNSTLNGTSINDPAAEEFRQKVPRKVRKHKVIIHSSPFLRCTQTAIAISAGIGQHYRTESEQSAVREMTTQLNPESEDVSPLTTPPRSSTPTGRDRSNGHAKRARPYRKPVLRIDAFLGEWLSPDYFDQITPPPGSIVMVTGAKIDLRRRGEPLAHAHHNGTSISSAGHFPGGWKRSQSPIKTPETPTEGGSFGMASLAEALPSEKRVNDGPPRSRSVKGITIRDVLSRSPHSTNDEALEGYVAPVPSYAISTSDPIPAGYVSHARDACVDVDFLWESMKPPQNWGDGGEYGEEWSAMHKRFRNGLLKMLDWYSHEHPEEHHNQRHHHHHHDEDDTDTVLVLVTHGAGCNALIGALTNQPVLIDVAMASLTMAVRKDVFKAKSTSPSAIGDTKVEHRASTPTPSLSHEYDVSLIASTEHLYSASSTNPMAIPQLPVPAPAPERSRPPSIYRHRADSSPIQFASRNSDPMSKPLPYSYGLQRSATANSTSTRTSTRGASGLWSSTTSTLLPEGDTQRSTTVDETAPHQSGWPRELPSSFKTIYPSEPKLFKPVEVTDAKSPSTPSSSTQPKPPLGLWSSNSSIAQAREPIMKRRWTVADQKN